MIAVEDAPTASAWYQRALGASVLWSLGGVVGLAIERAPFFLHEPTSGGFESPASIGRTTVRVEVFADNPDAFVAAPPRRAPMARPTRSAITRPPGASTGKVGSATRSVTSGWSATSPR